MLCCFRGRSAYGIVRGGISTVNVNMMQMPLLSYPHFSQFLQLQQQQQQQLQQRYSRALLSAQSTELGMPSSQLSGTSCSEASTGTPSPSPSPPLSITDNFPTTHQSASKATKSFTIDAILGIRDRDITKIARDHVSSAANSFHPRIGLHLPASHLELSATYSTSLDLTNGPLDISARRIGLSTASRDVLSFQLPTNLTTSSETPSFGTDVSRRDYHQISSYSATNSCTRLSENSSGDVSKKCGGKSKRVRTIFTPEQLERLEAEFERQQYMVGPERLYLAHTLQLTEAQVKVWFQNRRIKWRKQHLEIQQQRLAAIKQQHQRVDTEDSDEESGDSNSFSFSADTNDISSKGFFKSGESGRAELESPGQYREDVGSIHGENACDSRKSEPGSKPV